MLPLYRELQPDLSLSRICAALLDAPYPVLLDSSLPHPRLGRYSYLAADPFLVLRCKDGLIRCEGREGAADREGDPFDLLRELMAGFPAEAVPDLPPFQGGALGYFGYDLAHHVERLPRTTLDDVEVPDMVVGLYDWVLAQDHASGRTWLITSPYPDGDYGRALRRRQEILGLLEGHGAGPLPSWASGHRSEPRSGSSPGGTAPRGWRNVPVPGVGGGVASNFSREWYLESIRKAKEYIAAGDIYQVCLSQRFRVPWRRSPWELYSRLRTVSPVPYSAYLGLGDFAVASASPELFLRKEGRRVETRPIKGTRPRGRTPEEDRRLAAELVADEKDRAENVMIVDLLRNDLGRVCRVGSVRVPELYSLESYSTVHHLVSAVEGTLAEEHDAVSLLKACFPGGSITGCPKIRAMEIIDELEPTRRGVYCGSIGFVGFNGNLDTSIVIRTAVVKDGVAYYQAGGAIVADSDPESEYQETLDKARAMLLALGLAETQAEARDQRLERRAEAVRS